MNTLEDRKPNPLATIAGWAYLGLTVPLAFLFWFVAPLVVR